VGEGANVLPKHLQPWGGLLGGTWPPSAGAMPDERAVSIALRWVRSGEVSGLAIAMYCRPEGASNAEVLAACHDKKTNRARALHLERKLDFMKASMPDGTLRYFIGPAGSRPGPADAKPFVSRLDETSTPDGGLNMTEKQVAVPIGTAESLSPSDDYLEPEIEDEQLSVGRQDDRPVVSQISDWTISVLREKWDTGSLLLQPKFQREYVWILRPELPSRLIESLLLEIPIPPIYFGKDADGRLEMIDGQQRLTTLIKFVSNEFSLTKLNRMASL
jgi:hypothetical protein